jgi:hypothetical protein
MQQCPATREKPSINWTKLSGIAAAVTAAALIVAPATVVTAPPAYADCGDPGQDTCTGPVPTPDQVDAALTQLTDPNIACQDKTNLVTPGFSPDECGTVDDHLNRLKARGLLPFNFVVTDIQPAPNNFAGATVAVPTGPYHTPPGPIVLTDHGGRWLITNDTAMTLLDTLWRTNRRPIFVPPGGL